MVGRRRWLCMFAVILSGSQALADGNLLLRTTPRTVWVADLRGPMTVYDITDVASGDFNYDQRPDIAVAWFTSNAMNYDDLVHTQRYLTIFFGDGTGGFYSRHDFDLYIPRPNFAGTFQLGTGALAVADWDGDGDQDLAVLPFADDEIWFIENLRNGNFNQIPACMTSLDCSAGGFPQSPPEAESADFDGDGRPELCYIVDPLQFISGRTVHFWDVPPQAMGQATRMEWRPSTGLNAQYLRGLAVGDYDRDGKPDVCVTGTNSPPTETSPLVSIWYNFNLVTGRFYTRTFVPTIVPGDAIALSLGGNCGPSLFFTDRDGTTCQLWQNLCTSPPSFGLGATISGFAGSSINRGMSCVAADLDGDGDLDVVTKQRRGTTEQTNQVECVLQVNPGLLEEAYGIDGDGSQMPDLGSPDVLGAAAGVTSWVRCVPVSTEGLRNDAVLDSLRTRNLVVADLRGNSLPEIVSGFVTNAAPGNGGAFGELRVAIWDNACLGDADRNGVVDFGDLARLLSAYGATRAEIRYDPAVDLNRNGKIDFPDLGAMLNDIGCNAYNW